MEEDEQRTIAREIEEEVRSLARQHCMSKSMEIGQFLNPQGEGDDEIAMAYSVRDRTNEADEEDVVIPRLLRSFVLIKSSMKMEIVSGFHVSIGTKE